MEKFIFEFRYILAVLGALIIFSIFQWDYTKKKIYNAIIAAKQLAKEDVLTCGKEQEDWVVSKLMLILPVQVRLILNEDIIRYLVKSFYKNAIDLLDDGKINSSIKQ